MKRSKTLHWSILREYDIRGVVGETLSHEDARLIGQAFGTQVKRNLGQTVCVAYDGRISSPDMASALVDGLVSTGVAVIRFGMGPTPMLYFGSKILNADGAIMVTGSHNPANYNGFKMVMKNQPFFSQNIQKLGKIIENNDFVTGRGFAIWCSIMEEYVNRTVADYNGECRLKVAWDAGNGAAGPFIHGITRQLGGEHIIINSKVDGTFPNHHPDPTLPECLTQLRNVVLQEKCDLGIAFDGDGDRLGVIDNTGEIIWGDQLMVLLSRELLEKHPGAKIIADVKSSNVLFEQIEKMGGEPIMWRTGHSLIKKKMNECGALLAGEMSGHIFFNDEYYGFDDALYSAVRLLRVLNNSSEKLSDFRKGIPQTVNTPELRYHCDDSMKFQVIEKIKRELVEQGAEFNDIDGVRVTTKHGWWLLRASNTEAVLVARCEANNENNLKMLKRDLNFHLQNNGVIDVDKIAA